MDRVRWCIRLAALMAFATLLGVPAAQAEIVKPALRAHTAAVHPASAHRHARHHRHHRVPHATLSASGVDSHRDDPMPAAPVRQRNRAAIPLLVNGPRHAPGVRTNLKHTGLPLARGEVSATTVRALALQQHASPDTREHPVTSGRGPPRASPHRDSEDPPFPVSRAAALHAPPGASAASDVFTTVDLPRHVVTPDPPHFVAPDPRQPRVSFARAPSIRYLGLPHGRLHAVRPEGATVCVTTPSSGGFPCPVPLPLSC